MGIAVIVVAQIKKLGIVGTAHTAALPVHAVGLVEQAVIRAEIAFRKGLFNPFDGHIEAEVCPVYGQRCVAAQRRGDAYGAEHIITDIVF